MSPSLLFSQPITNLVWNRCRSAPYNSRSQVKIPSTLQERGVGGGGVDVVVLSTFRNTHIVHIVRDYVFSFIRIYLFIFLTFWIFILLLVARCCVTLFSDTEMIYQKIDNAVTKVMPLSARRWWWQKQQRSKTKRVFLSVKFSYKAAF